DLEEQQGLLPAEGAQASRGPCWALVVGTLLAAAALVSVFVVVFSAFVDTWLWPVLGVLLLLGHGLLLKATAGEKSDPSSTSHAALVCEALAYVALACTYFIRSFVVPWWWWEANALLFLLPATVLLTRLVFVYLSSGSRAEKASTVGYAMIALTCLLVALLLIFAGNFGFQSFSLSMVLPGQVHERIRPVRDFVEFKTTATESYETCDLATSRCRLKDLEEGQWTAIRPGGTTTCLVGDFEFLVYKGDPKKVLLHLHGGGACWNWVTFLLGACSRTAPMTPTGIFNASVPANPFYGYTVIDVPYCSGDIFGGATQNFWILAHQTASAWKSQSGYANLDAVMKWTQDQFHGPLPGLHKLTSFVVSGESAGSLGVQVWGSDILTRLEGQYEPKGTYLIGDSFMGVMVDDQDLLQRQVIDYWRMCDSGVVPPDLQPDCHPDKLFLADFVEDTMQDFPDVRYLMVDSKFDIVQQAFADMLVLLDDLWLLVTQGWNKVPKFTNATFYQEVTEQLKSYAAFPQFSAYLVDSNQHCYTIFNLSCIELTTPAGPFDNCSSPDVGERLLPWLTPDRTTQPLYQCYNLLIDSPPWTGPYCNSSLPWVAGKCEQRYVGQCVE
ncbi:unnamed protein product, partial [Symbiodinium pilosum]